MMILPFAVKKYRNKSNPDIIISVLDILAVDEDYKERAFIYEYENLDMGWQVSLNHHFLDDFELMEEE